MTQPVQDRNSRERLTADGASIGKLPNRLRSTDPCVGDASFRQSERFMAAVMIRSEMGPYLAGRTSPEWPVAPGNALIEPGCHRESIILVIGCVLDFRREQIPGDPPRFSGERQSLGKAAWISEGKIEPGK